MLDWGASAIAVDVRRCSTAANCKKPGVSYAIHGVDNGSSLYEKLFSRGEERMELESCQGMIARGATKDGSTIPFIT